MRSDIHIYARETGMGNQIHAAPIIHHLLESGLTVSCDSELYHELGLTGVKVSRWPGRKNYILYGYNWKKIWRIRMLHPFIKLYGFKYFIRGRELSLGLTESVPFHFYWHEFKNLKRLFGVGEVDGYSIPQLHKGTPLWTVIAISRKPEKTMDRRDMTHLAELITNMEGDEVIFIDKDPDNDFKYVDTSFTSSLIMVLKLARYLIASDSGAMHLADLMGVPTLALFGATHTLKNAPVNGLPLTRGLLCSPCYKRGRTNCHAAVKYNCMRFDPEDIYNEYIELKERYETT